MTSCFAFVKGCDLNYVVMFVRGCHFVSRHPMLGKHIILSFADKNVNIMVYCHFSVVNRQNMKEL